MSDPETAAALDLTCAECGRSPRPGETWRIYFADIGEAVTYRGPRIFERRTACAQQRESLASASSSTPS